MLGKVRNGIFVCMSGLDKEFGVKVVKALETRNIHDVFCMYRSDSGNTNMAGDNFLAKEEAALKNTGLFIFLFSKHTEKPSAEVQRELKYFKELMDESPYFDQDALKMVVIAADETLSPETTFDFSTLKSYFDSYTIRKNSCDIFDVCSRENEERKFNLVMDEIKEVWFRLCLKQHTSINQQLIDSYKFHNLQNTYMNRECIAHRVSEDILSSNEVRSDMCEFHILTNELSNYDFTTISTLVIARNLLGEMVNENGTHYYNPREKGIKYYYYVCEEAINESDMRRRLRSFLRKDLSSKKEVALWLINYYADKSRLDAKFVAFNNAHILINLSEITEHFSSEMVPLILQEYTKGPDSKNRFLFEVPACVREYAVSWRFTSDTFESDIKQFVEVLEVIVRDFSSGLDGDEVEVCKSIIRELNIILEFYLWQIGQLKPSREDIARYISKILPNRIGYPISRSMFTIMNAWLETDIDANGRNRVDEECIDDALKYNFHMFNIKDDEELRLAYSFILYIARDGSMTSAWYTTASDVNMANEAYRDDYVFVREEKAQNVTTKLREAFKYLVGMNKEIKNILTNHKSKLL